MSKAILLCLSPDEALLTADVLANGLIVMRNRVRANEQAFGVPLSRDLKRDLDRVDQIKEGLRVAARPQEVSRG